MQLGSSTNDKHLVAYTKCNEFSQCYKIKLAIQYVYHAIYTLTNIHVKSKQDHLEYRPL